jgi:queuine tRNA-ribosyltransferase
VRFRLVAECPETGARAGLLSTAHGDFPTPGFMPVGTLATVKGLTPLDLQEAGAGCILANAYHLELRPGANLIAALGGLHRFMSWDAPILTDSGGYQVHSLAALRETTEQGVRFISHLDRRPVELTPERVIQVQEQLGSDLIMPLDVCLGAEAASQEAEAALERTQRWAVRAQQAQQRSDQQLFGIVQGGLSIELRRQAARELQQLDFPGYAIGGLSVGEPREVTDRLVQATAAELPASQPRYLMGVGTPDQILEYTAAGIDMFDCVLPTRLGRTGTAFLGAGKLNLTRPACRTDLHPIEQDCDCRACTRFTRAQLHAALRASSPLGARLVSIHNVRSLIRQAQRARQAIIDGHFAQLLSAHRKMLATSESGPAPEYTQVSRSVLRVGSA